MCILKSETWGRVKTITGAIAAVAGLCWSAIVYAEGIIDEKILLQNNKTTIVLNDGFKSIQRQLLTVEERLIRSEIKDLLNGKNLSELNSEEFVIWEELKSDQELIKNAKRELDRLIQQEPE